MARRHRWDWAVRQELHAILHHIRSPSSSPFEHMVKTAIKCYLDGVDAQAELEKRVPAFQAAVACTKARTFLGNERSKRRIRSKEIIEERNRGRSANQFTSENLRVTIDQAQDRNYGMVNVTIYSMVEVWEVGEQNEPEKEYLVNFSDYATKEWLMRLMVWALLNQREVHVMPATEHQLTTVRMFVPKDKVT